MLSNSSSQTYQFAQRQFWTSYKLLGNMMKWKGIISDNILRELTIDGLLNRFVSIFVLMFVL